MTLRMKDNFKPGDTVHWKWGNGVVKGIVIQINPHRTEIISKGKLIARNGKQNNPAIVIKHENGNEVLKLASELLENQLT